MGTDILGAKGATIPDQDKIDLTVAGPCAVGVYRAQECLHHRRVSRARREELG
ncbi:hypothetical protein [Nitratireductor soli]|uniref:hypothetical protein n=1 Tax=Nitratireductor soli TaxID=1670619 RepID=UPI000A504600|nr:hypothetical protein [Nitratireductor soli]